MTPEKLITNWPLPGSLGEAIEAAQAAWVARGGLDAGRAAWERHCRELNTTPEEYELQHSADSGVVRQRVYQGQASRELPERPQLVALDARAGRGELTEPGEWLKSVAGQVAHREDGRWVGSLALLCGPAGIGKTVAACRLALGMADRCASVRYVSRYAEEWLRSDTPRRKQIATADLLVLDEAARALEQGAWIQGATKELLNERYDGRRATVLIYTGTLGGFLSGYGPEILDRIPKDLRHETSADERSRRWTP